MTDDLFAKLRKFIYQGGNAREALEHWPDAVCDYEMAIALRPDFPEALNNCVMVRIIRELRRATRLFELTSPSGRVARDAAEHLAILDAMLEGSARRARGARWTPASCAACGRCWWRTT